MKFCKEHKGVYPAEICPKCHADLRTRLEEAERERSDAEEICDDWEKSYVALQTENAVLKQKLEAVREWVKSYDPDWDNDINKLEKILDGDESD